MLTYVSSFKTPAPALDVEILHPITNLSATMLAKVDTAADQTIIPTSLVDILALEPVGLAVAQPVDSDTRVYITYLFDLIIAGRQFVDFEAAAAPINYIILGRDVLNELFITLDGPQLQFEIR
jgi:hypothetical protein